MAQASGSDEEYHSMSEQELAEVEEDEGDLEPPNHPVPSMQAAFEESIRESMQDESASLKSTSLDAEARRRRLLEAHRYDESWVTRWKQRPDALHHPLAKLMAQIIFGMHLLQQGQAKSDVEVVNILQTHVNEVDTFLERTSEDFDLAITDIEERIRHLKLPMEHLDVFNNMLDDKPFRTQLLAGNDKIEKIIDRTARAMNAALMDVRQGLQCTEELSLYLGKVGKEWPTDKNGIVEVLGAMRGNEQGWMKFLKELQAKGDTLAYDLIQLGTLIGEMSKLAAAASRRNRLQHQAKSASRMSRSAPASPTLRSKFARQPPPPMPAIPSVLNKPLPKEPDAAAGAARYTLSKLHPVPFADRYEKPRDSPQSPPALTKPRALELSASPPRPKTAGEPRDARVHSDHAHLRELANFIHSQPLRSNPPEDKDSEPPDPETTRITRSQSQGANDMLNSSTDVKPPARSKSQGAAANLNDAASIEAKSRPSTRGADRYLDNTAESTPRKDSVHSTGFSRRVSYRMNEWQSHGLTNGNPPPERQYIVNSAETTLQKHQPDTQESSTARTESSRPPSRLGLFPKVANVRSKGDGMVTDASVLHYTPSPTPTALPDLPPANQPKGRTMSIRNIFHRREKNRLGR